MDNVAAIVLAGGAGRRLGGVDKPALFVGRRSMLDRVLAASTIATQRIVVGSVGEVPPDVLTTVEDPPGGGPVAATAAGLALVEPWVDFVAVLAADLPFMSRMALGLLQLDVEFSGKDGAVFVDGDGRRQLLCGMWRVFLLREAIKRLAERRGELAGASMRELVDGMTVQESRWKDRGPPPWFDCDTEEDLRRAKKWAR
ncbi:molybdenum cofactor guanylyltransferase [Phytohabitans rumicis]|uniref:Molybdenum cofactor guanylyltransferase n=1 Tax=Phytohabitans rumicis TaxID=1076125 RepID=A0A6V8L986_9ACTN|nr:NTP transferase domain-containing protein [Phytohabitans rumicis]GFJ90646.1 molybdenum cofactor guanylyltransferase [Phytohabitans rumicis]